MTKAAKHFGKEAKEFLRPPSTASYIKALEKVGIPHVLDVKQGRSGGSFGHPKLAIRFAGWLSDDFQVWCDSIIEDILSGNAEMTITNPEKSATTKASTLPGVQDLCIVGPTDACCPRCWQPILGFFNTIQRILTTTVLATCPQQVLRKPQS